jgi:glutathione S-transferase
MCVQISFVDYLLFDLLDNHVILTPTALDGFPALKGFYDRIAARPAIHQYRQTEAHLKRPVNGNGKQ